MNEPWSCCIGLVCTESSKTTLTQGSRCLSEICVNWHQILCILRQWYKKCVQHFQELSHKLAKPKWWSSLQWADENSKKKVYRCTKKWKCSVNLLFRKSLNRSEHRTQHYFPKMNNSRWYRQTQFSSTVGLGNEMMSKSRLPLFFLIHIRCEHTFCLCFVVFCSWVNSDTCWHLD